MKRTENKVIVVAGATGGIGEQLCDDLARQGAKLALCGTNPEKVSALCARLRDNREADVYGACVDVTEEGQVTEFLKEAENRYGTPDALINLAGLSIPGKIEKTEESVYDILMDVNVKGTFLMAKHFAEHAQAGAQIINLGSMAARRVNGGAPLYCMAKTAVNILSQGLSLQLAEKKIRVTTLNPGGVDTPFWGDRPVKRDKLMLPQDVVDTILFVLDTNPRVAIHSIDFESMEML